MKTEQYDNRKGRELAAVKLIARICQFRKLQANLKMNFTTLILNIDEIEDPMLDACADILANFDEVRSELALDRLICYLPDNGKWTMKQIKSFVKDIVC